MRVVFATTYNSWVYLRLLDWCRDNDLLGDIGCGESEPGDFRVTLFMDGGDEQAYAKFLDRIREKGSGWIFKIEDIPTWGRNKDRSGDPTGTPGEESGGPRPPSSTDPDTDRVADAPKSPTQE